MRLLDPVDKCSVAIMMGDNKFSIFLDKVLLGRVLKRSFHTRVKLVKK